MLCHLGAVFHHDYGGQTVNVRRLGRVSARSSQPAWKNYYSVRNDILIARNMNSPLPDRVGVWFYFTKKFARASLGEIIYEKNFLQKWKYTLIGVWDGLLNRSGRRVAPVVK